MYEGHTAKARLKAKLLTSSNLCPNLELPERPRNPDNRDGDVVETCEPAEVEAPPPGDVDNTRRVEDVNVCCSEGSQGFHHQLSVTSRGVVLTVGEVVATSSEGGLGLGVSGASWGSSSEAAIVSFCSVA